MASPLYGFSQVINSHRLVGGDIFGTYFKFLGGAMRIIRNYHGVSDLPWVALLPHRLLPASRTCRPYRSAQPGTGLIVKPFLEQRTETTGNPQR